MGYSKESKRKCPKTQGQSLLMVMSLNPIPLLLKALQTLAVLVPEGFVRHNLIASCSETLAMAAKDAAPQEVG
jgi:hypothetical protein